MGGVRQPPASAKRVAEKVVYVDSPEIRKKYAKQEADLKLNHQKEVEMLCDKIAKAESMAGAESPDPALLGNYNRVLKENGELKQKIKDGVVVKVVEKEVEKLVEKIVEKPVVKEVLVESIKSEINKRVVAAASLASLLAGLGIGLLF